MQKSNQFIKVLNQPSAIIASRFKFFNIFSAVFFGFCSIRIICDFGNAPYCDLFVRTITRSLW